MQRNWRSVSRPPRWCRTRFYVQDGALTFRRCNRGHRSHIEAIEDDHGRDLALTVARRLVVFLKRPGGQSQFSAHLAAQIADEERFDHSSIGFSITFRWICSLDTLAGRVAMSVRNFTRVFQSETGTTPADFVEMARVDAARRRLRRAKPLCNVSLRAAALAAPTPCGAPFEKDQLRPQRISRRFRR